MRLKITRALRERANAGLLKINFIRDQDGASETGKNCWELFFADLAQARERVGNNKEERTNHEAAYATL